MKKKSLYFKFYDLYNANCKILLSEIAAIKMSFYQNVIILRGGFLFEVTSEVACKALKASDDE